MRVWGQRHAPAALPPGKTRYPLYRRLGRPQGQSIILKWILYIHISETINVKWHNAGSCDVLNTKKNVSRYSCETHNSSFNIIHLLCSCLIYTNLFPTNCTIHRFDASKMCIVCIKTMHCAVRWNKFVYIHKFCVANETGLTHRPAWNAIKATYKVANKFLGTYSTVWLTF